MHRFAPLALVTLPALVMLVGCAEGGLDDESVGSRGGNMEIFPTEDLDDGHDAAPCHPGTPGCDPVQPPLPDGGQTPPQSDAGQTPPSDGGHTPPPADGGACTWKTTICSMGGCNGHDGSNKAECYAEGNAGGCSAEVLEAWCTRRIPGSTLWYDLHDRWVKETCGTTSSTQDDNVFTASNPTRCLQCKCTTPLVLSFDGAPVSLRADDGTSHFDLSARQDGSETRTDWPAAKTPWLAIDRDGDGLISSGRELFGSATPLAGGTAQNGFEALAALDDDGDGVIDARDPSFGRLRLWADLDGDRVSSPNELRSLSAAGIESLQLHYVVAPRCDARGNCEVERATFRWIDGAGQVHVGALVDVHLAVR